MLLLKLIPSKKSLRGNRGKVGGKEIRVERERKRERERERDRIIKKGSVALVCGTKREDVC